MAWKKHFKQTHFHRVLARERGLAYPTSPWRGLGTPEREIHYSCCRRAWGQRSSCVSRHLLSLDLEFWIPQPCKQSVFKCVQECSRELQEDAEGSVFPLPRHSIPQGLLRLATVPPARWKPGRIFKGGSKGLRQVVQGEQCWEWSFPEAAAAAPLSWKGGWKTRPASPATGRADSTEQELIQIIMQMSRHARSVTLGYLHTPPSLSRQGLGLLLQHISS